MELKFLAINSVITCRASSKSIEVYRLEKSQENILESEGKNDRYNFWIRFWESKIKDSEFLTKFGYKFGYNLGYKFGYNFGWTFVELWL